MSAKLLYVPFSGIKLSVHEVVAPVIMSDELRTMIRQVDAQYRSTNSPTTLQALNGRLDRGLEIALAWRCPHRSCSSGSLSGTLLKWISVLRGEPRYQDLHLPG